MKYELKIEADTPDELFNLFKNLKDRPINELPKPSKVVVEVGDEPQPQPEPEPVKEESAAPVITIDDVRRKFKEKANTGNKAHMREILQHYGADCVSNLSSEHYADVMQELELVEA